MNWSDYEAVWKRQTPPVGANAGLTMLKETFDKKSRKMAAALQVRDYAEASAGLLVALCYGFHWWQVGANGWPLGIGILLILSVVIRFLRERRRARQSQASPYAPLLDKVSHDLAELRHQRRLSGKIWAWYLAPCVGAMLTQGSVIIRQSAPWSIIREPVGLISLALLIGLAAGFAWLINVRAIHKNIDPRIAELEKLRRDLQGVE